MESVLFGIFLSVGISSISQYIPLEAIILFTYVYYLFTFTLSYPDSSHLRRFIVTFLLSFADIAISIIIFQQPLPEKIWILLFEFLVIHILLGNMTPRDIEQILARKYLRMAIYIATGALKSITLVTTAVYASKRYELYSLRGFLINILINLIKLTVPIFIYYADRIIGCESSFDKKSKLGIYKRIKYSFILTCIIIESVVIWPQDVENFFYEPSLSVPALIGNTLMIVWYILEGYSYGQKLRKD